MSFKKNGKTLRDQAVQKIANEEENCETPNCDDNWRECPFQDFSWKSATLHPGSRLELRYGETSLVGNELRLSMENGRGKISDAGYDQFVCYYAELPADCDVILCADVEGRVVLKSAFPTFQEGFGIFLRDAMTPDPLSGLFYSNMAAVGGYYGRGNFFGRLGIKADNMEEVGAFFYFGKPEDENAASLPFLQSQTYRLELGKEGAGIWGDVRDALQERSALGNEENAPDGKGDFVSERERRWLRTPPGIFEERDSKSIYFGFFAANGGEMTVDVRSIKILWRKRTTKKAPQPVVYASPTGKIGGDGGLERPYDLVTAIQRCEDGGEVRALPGKYLPQEDVLIGKSASGSAESRKKLVADREYGGVPIIDFGGTNRALRLDADFWEIDGIHATGGHGIIVQGSRNVIRNCRSYRNFETGILIRHADIDAPKDEWPRDNLVENCVSYRNADRSGRNADGFACKVAAGEGNRFENCLALLNSDDGFDLFAKNRRIGAVVIKNCKSVLNGYDVQDDGTLVATAGNGVGFKLGGSGLAIDHTAENCEAIGNKNSGFSSNSNPTLRLFSCSAKNNGKPNINYYYYGAAATPVKIVENCEVGDDPDFNTTASLERIRVLLTTQWSFDIIDD